MSKKARFPLQLGLWLLPVIAAVVVGSWRFLARDHVSASPVALAPAQWVDEASCQGCHADPYAAWTGSHHQRAMQPARDDTVQGDFHGATLVTDVETTRFSRRDGGFWITTPDANGAPADFPVAYTFGVEPLQQYLLAMSDGRLQVHGAAWDGQRWFHLYDGQGVDHHHPLHWSGAQQNADFMCIECHTTGFQRTPGEGDSHSRWQAMGVGCQSCHGPASNHLAWASEQRGGDRGFQPSLARRGDPAEVEVCARCHSRRSPLGNGYTHGNRLLDDYLPVILSAELYEVDGKIKDEVFEYGSFRQSRMHAAGVVCSDCHDPHSARLRVPANAVCAQCHNPAGKAVRAGIDAGRLQARGYDDPSHHHHAPGSAGAQCASCHMPGKLYMGNDLRRDHSFSSPNPLQAQALGHSDACLGCHEREAPDRIIARFQQWYPDAQPRDGGYARDLHAARRGLPGAAEGLLRQLARADQPDIRRATLLSELPKYPSTAAQRALAQALGDPSELVRQTAVGLASALLSPEQQAMALAPLAADPVRAVRLAAAWELLQLPPPLRPADPSLISEYEQAQQAMAERAESHYNLAGAYRLSGREHQVEPALRRALAQDPAFHPARIMLAQWQEQAAGDPGRALALLRQAITDHPAEASLHHALGLTLVRQGRRGEALDAFRQAHALAPTQSGYGYVLAVALHDGGQRQQALDLLRELVRQDPADRAVRLALVSYLEAAGERDEAQALLGELAAQNPWDPLLRQRDNRLQ